MDHPLHRYLRRRRLTQRQLAPRIGMSFSFLNQIMTGYRRPSVDTARKIERATGVSAAAILLWEREPADATEAG